MHESLKHCIQVAMDSWVLYAARFEVRSLSSVSRQSLGKPPLGQCTSDFVAFCLLLGAFGTIIIEQIAVTRTACGSGCPEASLYSFFSPTELVLYRSRLVLAAFLRIRIFHYGFEGPVYMPTALGRFRNCRR